MKIVSRIVLKCTKNASEETINKINNFYKKNEKFIVNKDIGKLIIPIDDEAYAEVIKLKECSPKEIYYTELFERKYSKEDYIDAVAFIIHFTNMSYGYADKGANDYFNKCCSKGNLLTEQSKDYEMPKSEIKNKNFAQSDIYRFIISTTIRKNLLSIGVDEKNFRPVWQNKDYNNPIAYQISPMNILPPLSEVNGWRTYIGCKYCKKILYHMEDNKPYYISHQVYKELKDFNISLETVGNICTPLYIVNYHIYNYLKSQYKSMYFEPMFLK